MINLTTHEAMTTGALLFEQWGCIKPVTVEESRRYGMALAVTHFPKQLRDVLARADMLENHLEVNYISPNLSGVKADELFNALDTDCKTYVDAIAGLAGLVFDDKHCAFMVNEKGSGLNIIEVGNLFDGGNIV